MKRFLQCVVFAMAMTVLTWAQGTAPSRKGFRVTYVDLGTVYLDAGANSGLEKGMDLNIKRPRVMAGRSGDGLIKATVIIAKVTVISVSKTSAMCEVRSSDTEVHRGDLAFVTESEQQKNTEASNRIRAASEGQTFGPQARAPVFKPALNEIDRENEKPVARPAPANNTAAAQASKDAPPISLADAARANRQKPLQPAPPAAPSGPAPAPAAGNATTSPGAPGAPLSLGEIARRNRHRKSSPDGEAARVPAAPAKTPGPSTQPAIAAGSVNAGKPPEPAAAETTASAMPPTTAAPPAKAAAKPAAAASAGQAAAPAPANPDVATGNKALVARAIVPAPPSPAIHTPATHTTPPVSSINTPAPQGGVPAGSSVNSQQPVTWPAVAPAKPIAPGPSSAIAASIPGAKPPEVAAATPNVVPVSTPTQPPAVQADFKVKYVAEDAVYIEGGKNAGLTQGMTLTITRMGPAASEPRTGAAQTIAEVAVVSVSNTSAVCEIREKTADIQRGDVALLSQADQQKIVDARTLGPTRKYPQVIAFSEGDPLDEEAREAVPKPPLPEVNRARGRIGVDYSLINSRGSGVTTTSTQTGGVVRVDMSRIGGTYWSLNGYWRGRVNLRSSAGQPQSVYDLVNRTYTIGFTYVNPGSRWTAGAGRLFLPWATSLDTIDGGYLGRKIGSHTTLGIFAGSTPDPASFDYNPDRRLAGTFVAFEGGSFDSLRFTSAEGVAVSAIQWKADRQFVFSENGLFYKRFLSIYHSAQADIQQLPTGGKTEGLSRSFATLRLQPFSRFSIDVNHNYFRDVPTFDPSLVGTGLLDKFLFQGVSAGARVELPGRISLYSNFGQSSKSGDAQNSLNQLYGITIARLWVTGLRGDVRYSKFDSSFGRGNYRAASLSRNFADIVRIEVNAGQQQFVSSLGVPTDYRLYGSTVDLSLGGHYFIESAVNLQRGGLQNFDQFLVTMGYRFDSGKRK